MFILVFYIFVSWYFKSLYFGILYHCILVFYIFVFCYFIFFIFWYSKWLYFGFSYFYIFVFWYFIFFYFAISHFDFKIESFRSRCCSPPHDCVNPSHRCLKVNFAISFKIGQKYVNMSTKSEIRIIWNWGKPQTSYIPISSSPFGDFSFLSFFLSKEKFETHDIKFVRR